MKEIFEHLRQIFFWVSGTDDLETDDLNVQAESLVRDGKSKTT
jgi:hypothetical protein